MTRQFSGAMLEYLKIGPSPSGKALGFGPSIRRFESCRSSHNEIKNSRRELFCFIACDDGALFISCRSSHFLSNKK